MATPNGAYASGAGKDDAEVRRRNVQSFEKANGGTVYKLEAEDTKKLQKVRVSCEYLRFGDSLLVKGI